MPVAKPTYCTSPLPLSWVTTATRTPAFATRKRPGSIQNLKVGNLRRSSATPGIQGGQIDLRLRQLFGHAEAAAQINHTNVRKAPRQIREQRPGLGPVGDVKNAAAGVCMQSDHAGAGAAHQGFQLLRLGDGHAELRMHAGGAHVLMMTAAEPGVDAHEHFPVAKQLRPHLERIQIVEA